MPESDYEDEADDVVESEGIVGSEDNTKSETPARDTSIQSAISERMKSNLTNVYIDILEFFRCVAQIFVRADGSKLRG